MKSNHSAASSDEDEYTDHDQINNIVDTSGSTAEPLSIRLPDGSESVSEAILSHRQMLTNPGEYDLASAETVADMRETIARLTEDVPPGLRSDLKTLESSVEEVISQLEQQQQQIEELRQATTSLAEILGASVEFSTDLSATDDVTNATSSSESKSRANMDIDSDADTDSNHTRELDANR
ncbi:hypothetical protein [Haloquadratum walsbyi]|jgi:hypothetical protein|uniref:Uncharacterized protein n=1 Tax=Haloquadratum walsbyi J07HQW2 TaxID=1238425 RepID=U1NHY9_9EURY|nr:hypothetical protein [Haloquadratum walsbyi]ERG96498.1 MAG: hypothetical protein J07HQW2_02978 [Haloquadratum walsbyi J07HQW2]